MSKENLIKYQQIGRLKDEKDKRLTIMINEIKSLVMETISTPEKDHIYYRVEDNENRFLSNGEDLTKDLVEQAKLTFSNCVVNKLEESKYLHVCWR